MPPFPPSTLFVRLPAGMMAFILAAALLRSAGEAPAPLADATQPSTATAAVESLKPDTPKAEAPKADAAKAVAAAKPAPVVYGLNGQSEDIRGALKIADAMTERGDWDGAETTFRSVITNPDGTPAAKKRALLGMAHMFRKRGAMTKSIAVYEKYLKEYPGDDAAPDALLDLGRSLRATGAYRTAIARFYSVINSTLKIPPGGFEHYQQLAKTAQFEIAQTHFEAGEYAEAGKFFSRLRLLDLAAEDRAQAHFMAAYSMYLQGVNDETVSMLTSFVEQWPTNENIPEARYLLATSLHQLHRSQEAFAATLALLQAAKGQIADNPKRWSYWQRRTGNQLANDFFTSGDILNAESIYASLATLSDDPTWQLPVTYQLALCYDRLGANDRAHLSYQSIVDGVKADSPASLQELKRLAQWRLSQLDWSDKINHQVTSLIDTSTGKPASPTGPKIVQANPTP